MDVRAKQRLYYRSFLVNSNLRVGGFAPRHLNRSGAWTGIVSYTRTQTNTNDKTVQRVSGRGEDTTNWEMKYDYKARVAIIESPEKNGSSVGKASISK